MDALAKASPLGVRKVKPPLKVWAALWNRLYRGGLGIAIEKPTSPQPCSTFVVNITSGEQGSWRVCIVLTSRPRWMVRVLSEVRAPEECASYWRPGQDGWCESCQRAGLLKSVHRPDVQAKMDVRVLSEGRAPEECASSWRPGQDGWCESCQRAELLKSVHRPDVQAKMDGASLVRGQGSWRVYIVLTSRPRWMVRVLSEGRAPEECTSSWRPGQDGWCESCQRAGLLKSVHRPDVQAKMDGASLVRGQGSWRVCIVLTSGQDGWCNSCQRAGLLKSVHHPDVQAKMDGASLVRGQGSWRVCIVLTSRPRWMVRVLSEGRAPEESASPWQTPCDGQCVSLAFLSGAGAWRTRLKPMAPSWRDRLYDYEPETGLVASHLSQSSIPSLWELDPLDSTSGARPTKHISIEFEIRWKFRTL